MKPFLTQLFGRIGHLLEERRYLYCGLENLNEQIRACSRGERTAQANLYTQYAPGMFVVCQRYARNREEAEEILQEGFLQVFRHIDQFRFEGSFEGWVRKIMVNAALQKFRTSKKMYPVVDIGNSGAQMPDVEYIYPGIEFKELIKLVQTLPAGYRMVFNLFVFEGLKHREISELLQISEGTSKSNLSDARQILQKAVQHHYKTAKSL